MLSFCGQDKCTVDGNGRLKLTQHFIDDFLARGGGEVVMHCLAEGAVALYPEEVFHEMRRRELESTGNLGNSLLARRDLRRFGALSRSEVITRQGRITLPEPYRLRAELLPGTEVYLVGVEVGVEIWNMDRWNREMMAMDEYLTDRNNLEISRSLGKGGLS